MLPDDRTESLRRIRLFAMDVDGVLTAGEIIYTGSGDEIKQFHAKDGHGLAMLGSHGFPVAWVTGRVSVINERRAKELHVPYLFQGVTDKLPVVVGLAEQLDLSLSEVAYMGDDTPDIPVLKAVGLAICPRDAVASVQAVCPWVTEQQGGRGAVREVVEALMAASRLSIPGLDAPPKTRLGQ